MQFPRRISLRTIMFVFAAVCIVLGIWRFAENRRAEIKKVERQQLISEFPWFEYDPIVFTDTSNYVGQETSGRDYLIRAEGLDFSIHESSHLLGDSDVVGLAALPNLVALNISHTQVSDSGLKAIASIRKLKVVYLIDCQVTEAGAKWLRNQLPECEVFRKSDQVPNVRPLPDVYGPSLGTRRT